MPNNADGGGWERFIQALMLSKVAGTLEMNGRVSSTLKKCLLQVYSILRALLSVGCCHSVRHTESQTLTWSEQKPVSRCCLML